MRAGQDAHADHVDILLNRCLDDFLRRTVQAGVNHIHAGIAQGAGDDFDAAIMPVQADLGDENANDFFLRLHSIEPRAARPEEPPAPPIVEDCILYTY